MYVTYRCEERETAEAVKDVDCVVRAHVNKLLDCLIATDYSRILDGYGWAAK